MYRPLMSCIPFLTCLFWFIQYAINYKKKDLAKRMYMWFLATCVVLYFCHYLFFTVGLSHPMECLWTLCSLSVYPLFYAYIYRLTSRSLATSRLAQILLPGAIVAFCKFLFPGDEMNMVQKIVNSIQIILVAYHGYRHLRAFDNEIMNIYADTEGRDTKTLKKLLIAFVLTSICSAVANFIGKNYFASSDIALGCIMMTFMVMLYSLSYICYVREFSVEQLIGDTPFEIHDERIDEKGQSDIGLKIENLMTEEQLYLTKKLKINDVSKRLGLCRTYVSNYINQTHDCNFSDYINKLRVEHAKKLLQTSSNTKHIVIAESSGFSSEQTFYRNFKKFTGTFPAEWLRK